jgi:hypothetical protein
MHDDVVEYEYVDEHDVRFVLDVAIHDLDVSDALCECGRTGRWRVSVFVMLMLMLMRRAPCHAAAAGLRSWFFFVPLPCGPSPSPNNLNTRAAFLCAGFVRNT